MLMKNDAKIPMNFLPLTGVICGLLTQQYFAVSDEQEATHNNSAIKGFHEEVFCDVVRTRSLRVLFTAQQFFTLATNFWQQFVSIGLITETFLSLVFVCVGVCCCLFVCLLLLLLFECLFFSIRCSDWLTILVQRPLPNQCKHATFSTNQVACCCWRGSSFDWFTAFFPIDMESRFKAVDLMLISNL